MGEPSLISCGCGYLVRPDFLEPDHQNQGRTGKVALCDTHHVRRFDPFAAAQRAWWDTLSLAPAERLRAYHDLALLDYLAGLLDEVEAELAQLSRQAPWVTQVPFLLQLPGIGLIPNLCKKFRFHYP